MFDYDPSARGYIRKNSDNSILIGYDADGTPFFTGEKSLEGHLSVTGKTGTGKSSLLVSMIRSMDRVPGNIVVIDPHGTLIDSVFLTERPLVYISSDTVERQGKKYSVKMNIMDKRHDPDLTSGWIRDIFSSESFSNNTWGPRLEVIFRAILPEYIRNETRPSLAGFVDTITSPRSMKLFLENIKNRSLRSFLETYTKDREYWREYIASSLNKIIPTLTNEKIRSLISSDDSFDFYEACSAGNSIIFVDASKGKVSDEASEQISLLFLMRIWFDSLYRYNEGKVVRNYIFIDEAQNIPKEMIKTMLSEGRKYGISLILSNQYVSQSREYSDSLYGNVRNFISFNVSESDASFLSRTIPDARMAKGIYETLLNQRIHRFLYWSADQFSTRPLSLEIRTAEVKRDERITESIISHGSENTGDDHEGGKESLHETILSRLDSYLFSRQIELKHGKIKDTIPDGYFYYGSSMYIVEVEISDTDKPFRILRKIRDYKGSRIIFITDEERSEKLWNILMEPVKNFEENPCLMEGGDRVCIDDVATLYRDVFLVVYDRNFYIRSYDGNHRFSVNQLDTTPYMKKIRKNKYFYLLNHLYDKMIHDRTYTVNKDEIKKEAFYERNYIDEFFQKKETISLYDIFLFQK